MTPLHMDRAIALAGSDALGWGLPALTAAPVGAPAQVDVLVVDLDAEDASSNAGLDGLSAHERERCGRFKFDHDRRRFAAGRRALRQELSRRTGVAADGVALRIGMRGRPCLDDAAAALDFSFSHSGRWLAIASSRQAWVGVDIEPASRAADLTGLEASVLAQDERSVLCALPAADRPLALLGYWTGKEAFMKLNAMGLHLPPTQIHVRWHGAQFGTASSDAALWVPQASIQRHRVVDAICAVATPAEARINWRVAQPSLAALAARKNTSSWPRDTGPSTRIEDERP